MKKILSITTLSIILLISSCSKDDSPVIEDPMTDPTTTTNPTITSSDFSTTINENPEANTVIGNIVATTTHGTLNYSITTQSPSGAIAINPISGEITVADATAFDFETNPTITATVNIAVNSTSKTSDVSITLNDIDDLEYLLSISKASYTAASDGDWIEITETEYNNLTSELNEVNKVGMTDTSYDTASAINGSADGFTFVNSKEPKSPENSYVFAFKYNLSSGTDVTGFRVKQSESTTTGYLNLGNTLPKHSGTNTTLYFVLKGNSTSFSNESFIGVYTTAPMEYVIGSGQGYYYYNGDATTNLKTTYSNTIKYQALSSTQKQW